MTSRRPSPCSQYDRSTPSRRKPARSARRERRRRSPARRTPARGRDRARRTPSPSAPRAPRSRSRGHARPGRGSSRARRPGARRAPASSRRGTHPSPVGDHEMEETALAPARLVERHHPGAVGRGQLGHPSRRGSIVLQRESGVEVVLPEGPEHERGAGERRLGIGNRRVDRRHPTRRRASTACSVAGHNCTTCDVVRWRRIE